MKKLGAILFCLLTSAALAGTFIQPSRGPAVSGGGGASFPATGQTAYFDNFDDSGASTNLNTQALTSGGGTWSETTGLMKEGATAGKVTVPSGTDTYATLVTGTMTITSGNYGVGCYLFPNGTTSTKRLTLVGRANATFTQYYTLQVTAPSGAWFLSVGPSDYTFCQGTLSDWSSGTTTHQLELRMVGSTITAWDEGVQISTACVDTHWPGASGDTVQFGIRNGSVQVDSFTVVGR